MSSRDPRISPEAGSSPSPLTSPAPVTSRDSASRDRDEVAADGQARILEPGYRPYRGVRLGVAHSVWALARHTAERIMGLKRPARYKVLPFAAVLIAYLPAIAFIGIVALLPRGRIRLSDLIPGPGRYYAFITAAIILFAALWPPLRRSARTSGPASSASTCRLRSTARPTCWPRPSPWSACSCWSPSGRRCCCCSGWPCRTPGREASPTSWARWARSWWPGSRCR